MTRQEILTKLVCSYIQGTGKFPKLSADGSLNDAWKLTVEAIIKTYPEGNTVDEDLDITDTTLSEIMY